jgi:hypothetical protein
MRLKPPYLILLVLLVLVVHGSTNGGYAQTSQSREVKAAATSFYRMHIAHFGFPLEDDLKRLNPSLSPELSSLLANELRRMREWSAKNPDQKPPVIEDLFVCNRYEAPQKFRVLGTKFSGGKALATVKFEYIEGGKVIASCEVEATFVRPNRKWLLDNADWEGTSDLRTLLSRKDYTVVPE